MKTLPVVAIALFMVACGGNKKNDTKNYENLTANEWILSEVVFADSASQVVIPDSVELRMAFADSNKVVYGIAPCNGFFGPFTVAGTDSLSFGNLASTMAYCLDMPFESAYLASLNTITNYAATDSTLTLMDGGNKVTLVYVVKK